MKFAAAHAGRRPLRAFPQEPNTESLNLGDTKFEGCPFRVFIFTGHVNRLMPHASNLIRVKMDSSIQSSERLDESCSGNRPAKPVKAAKEGS